LGVHFTFMLIFPRIDGEEVIPVRSIIVDGRWRIERESHGLYSVWRIRFYANLLNLISPYRSDLALVRRTMLTPRIAGTLILGKS
jgi:hypothetical protein